MLDSHLNTIEKVLREQGRIASIAGHPDLIGSSREWFVRNFLIDHLPETIKVGQGEIINASSQPKAKRNQIDVVLYRREFPQIRYSENNHAFLRESVVATIEIKSTINITEFRKACKASKNHKNRQFIQEPDPKRPYQPIGIVENLKLPSLSTYVVAYNVSNSFTTVANWFPKIAKELQATPDSLIDMMIVLGKGTVWRLESFPPLSRQINTRHPNGIWAFLEQDNKNLLLLFLHMLSSVSPIGTSLLDYVKNVPFSNIRIIEGAL